MAALALVGTATQAMAGHLRLEKEYQLEWCAAVGGQAEVILADRSRCDCLTASHAVEVDFARKWPEAVGQSFYYSMMTGKRAGILLILERPEDRLYLDRLTRLIKALHLEIDTWTVGPGGQDE